MTKSKRVLFKAGRNYQVVDSSEKDAAQQMLEKGLERAAADRILNLYLKMIRTNPNGLLESTSHAEPHNRENLS